MNTGAKVAIGCGIGCLVVGIAALVVMGGAAWFVKGKTEGMLADQREIEELREQVNREPFEAPPDGVVREDRLLAFLEIRRQVHEVFEPYREQIERQQDEPSLSQLTGTLSMISEIRRAQARAQVAEGMSDAEYAWLVGQVYRSMWAGALEDATGETRASAAIEQAIRGLREQLSNPDVSDAQRELLEQQIEQMRRGAAAADAEFDVPPENLALFRRHREEIERFSMHGLELIGL